MARIDTRRYHRNVSILKSELEVLNIRLRSFDEAYDSDICIISKNDYELMDYKTECQSCNEPYFISEEEYETYRLEFEE